MIKRLLIIAMVVFATSNISTTIDDSDPYKLINEVVKNTFERLKTSKLNARSNPKYLLDIVDQELLPYMQIQYLSTIFLGKNYEKNLTSSQRAAYFSVFREYLKQICARALSLYHGQEYKIAPAQPLGSATVVPIRVIIGSNDRQPIRIDFQLRKNRKVNSWRIYDIAIEGVSMIDSKQNEWSNVLHDKGIDGLIDKLQSIVQKNHSE